MSAKAACGSRPTRLRLPLSTVHRVHCLSLTLSAAGLQTFSPPHLRLFKVALARCLLHRDLNGAPQPPLRTSPAARRRYAQSDDCRQRVPTFSGSETELGTISPGHRPPVAALPWGTPPLGTHFFWGPPPLGQKAGQKAGEKAGQKPGEKAEQKAGQKSTPFLKGISLQKAGQKAGEKAGQEAGELSGEKAGEEAGGIYPGPQNTGT